MVRAVRKTRMKREPTGRAVSPIPHLRDSRQRGLSRDFAARAGRQRPRRAAICRPQHGIGGQHLERHSSRMRGWPRALSLLS